MPKFQPVWSDAKTKPQRKSLYLSLIPVIREVARNSGYAIGVHGSLTRDLDLIAAPWTPKAVSPNTLALRIEKAICKYPSMRTNAGARKEAARGKQKPWGRRAYTMLLGCNGAYVDLSVVPKGELYTGDTSIRHSAS